MTMLLICGLMLTFVAFGREHILLGFGRVILSGPDTPFGCFDIYRLANTAPTRPFTPWPIPGESEIFPVGFPRLFPSWSRQNKYQTVQSGRSHKAQRAIATD